MSHYVYQVRAGVQRSAGTSYANWSTIDNAAHRVEIGWQSAGSAAFSLYVDACSNKR